MNCLPRGREGSKESKILSQNVNDPLAGLKIQPPKAWIHGPLHIPSQSNLLYEGRKLLNLCQCSTLFGNSRQITTHTTTFPFSKTIRGTKRFLCILASAARFLFLNGKGSRTVAYKQLWNFIVWQLKSLQLLQHLYCLFIHHQCV